MPSRKSSAARSVAAAPADLPDDPTAHRIHAALSATRFPDITISLPMASPQDEQDNSNAISAAFSAFNQARLRMDIKVYGPPARAGDKPRYWFLLGMAPTLICRTPEAVEHCLDEIHRMLTRLNGWIGGAE